MSQPGVAFVIEQLRLRPDATLEDLRARAAIEGRRVQAETYRRARIELGLDPPSSSLPAPPPVVPAAAPVATMRQRERAPEPAGDLDPLTAAVRALVQDRDRCRAALERMRDVVRAALRAD